MKKQTDRNALESTSAISQEKLQVIFLFLWRGQRRLHGVQVEEQDQASTLQKVQDGKVVISHLAVNSSVQWRGNNSPNLVIKEYFHVYIRSVQMCI